MIEIDHIGIAARDALRSARALAEILGAAEPTVDGADDDMYRVDLEHGAALLFSTSETVGVGGAPDAAGRAGALRRSFVLAAHRSAAVARVTSCGGRRSALRKRAPSCEPPPMAAWVDRGSTDLTRGSARPGSTGITTVSNDPRRIFNCRRLGESR
jgi:hypothetical protein